MRLRRVNLTVHVAATSYDESVALRHTIEAWRQLRERLRGDAMALLVRASG